MAHYQVIFKDTKSLQIIHFDEFSDAQDFWNNHAESADGGEMIDLDNGEIIWDFGEMF